MAFENGYINLDGILSSTRSYAPESMIVGKREFEDITFAMGKPKESITYYEYDKSWGLELKEFIRIFFEEKKTYLVKLEVILSLIDEQENASNLAIKGEIEFFLNDNTSINDRKRLLNKTIKNLITSIDKSLNENITKTTFNKFYSKANF